MQPQPPTGRDAAAAGPRLRRLVLVGLAAFLVAGLAVGWRVWRDSPDREPVRTTPLSIQLPINPAELDPEELGRALGLARRAGVTEVGAGATWWYLTRGRPLDSYDWRPLDRLVEAASARGIRVRLQLTGTPDGVHPTLSRTVPDPDLRHWYPPRTPAELRRWGQFVHATVAHFRGRVRDYEMWNEPNIAAFWRPAPSPAEYAALLAEGYRSVKQAWPSARVIFGGLSHNDVGYLQRYHAEARRLFPDAPSHRYFFDVLSVHPYTDGRSPDETSPDTVVQGAYGPIDKSFGGLRLMKAVLDRNQIGGEEKSVLIGEYGFSVTGRSGVAAVPDRRRAYFLKRAVAAAQTMPFVSGLCWYGFLPDSSTENAWAIASPSGGTSWTYQALVDLAGGHELAVGLPDASHLQPGRGAIKPRFGGVNPADVEHSELYVDGVLQAEADGPEVRWTSAVHRPAAGHAQLVVYTRGWHTWTSDVVTLTGQN